MTRFEFHLRQPLEVSPRPILLLLGICVCLALMAVNAPAQLQAGQSNGFFNDALITLTYTQNFDCVVQSLMDVNFKTSANGQPIPAQSDPGSMQTPICQAEAEPTEDPTGKDIKLSQPLYVLIPMFSVDHDTNVNDAIACPTSGAYYWACGPALGTALLQFFHVIPEAWKEHPLVSTQCPDPNTPVSGTCTMHSPAVDVGKLLGVGAHVFVPSPNHDHIIGNPVNTIPIWWVVRPVLISDPNDWPTPDGSKGIRSVTELESALAAGTVTEVGSNYFLFFSSHMAH